MKILFIGGTGIISTAVSELLAKQGEELYLLNRGERNEFAPKGVIHLKGDAHNIEQMKTLLKDKQFDVVVDWIAFNTNDIQRDIDLFSGKTKQFIFISSASAYQKPSKNYLITEETPLENPYWEYSRHKIACENMLMEEYRRSGFPVTIVRPSFTFGNTLIPASVTNNMLPFTLVERIRSGKKVIVQGDGASLWVMTHNSDFAKGFAGLFGRKEAIGEAFHITSDEVQTWNQIYETIYKVLNREPNIIHIPSDFINHCNKNIGMGLLGDKAVSVDFDNSKIKKLVPDFKCTVTYEECIRRSYSWLLEHPKYCGVDHKHNEIMDDIIRRYEHIYH